MVTSHTLCSVPRQTLSPSISPSSIRATGATLKNCLAPVKLEAILRPLFGCARSSIFVHSRKSVAASINVRTRQSTRGGSSLQERLAERIEQGRYLVNDKVASIGALTLNIPIEVFSMEIEGTWNFAIATAMSVHSILVHA